MRISGLTIVRNTVELGYPFEESIRSLLPLVDEMIVAIGDSRDGTWEAMSRIEDKKIHAFRTIWNIEEMGALVLSKQTNLALERCSGDWAIYLQADEVLHEDDVERLRTSLHHHLRRRTEGLLFDYFHFFGDYGWVGGDWRFWYPRAFRAVKLGIGVVSVGDAAGFLIRRHGRLRGLIGASSAARVFHYGWCRPPAVMSAKQRNLESLYAKSDRDAAGAAGQPPWASIDPGRLRSFRGTHPRVMAGRISAQSWSFDPADIAREGRRPPDRHLSSECCRRFLRYRVPTGAKNAYWRSLDAWMRISRSPRDARR